MFRATPRSDGRLRRTCKCCSGGRLPTPCLHVIEIVGRVSGHLHQLDSLVNGLEVDVDLADVTWVGDDPGWAAPLRLVHTPGRPGAGGSGTAVLPESRRQRAVQAIDQLREVCDLSDERAADLMRVAPRYAAKLASWYPGALPGDHASPVRGGQPCLDPGQVPWPRSCPRLAPASSF